MSKPNEVISVEQIFEQAAALHEQGNFDQAEKLYRAIFIGSLNNLAALCVQTARFEEAAGLARELLRFVPASGSAYNTLGTALEGLNRLEEAAVSYQRAVDVMPEYVEAYVHLTKVLMILGRIDEAQHAIEVAIKVAPRRVPLYLILTELKQFVVDDPQVAAMEELAEQMTSLATEEQMRLHFALGKALADLGRHEQSFRHLLAGNAIKRRQIVYDEARVLRSFDRPRTAFTRKLMQDNDRLGHPSSVPVFIIGMPRSGTTLVEQLLASHPKVFGAGEVSYFANAIAQLCGSGETLEGYTDEIPVLVGAQLHELGEAYLKRITATAPSAERIIDKMPANFRFAGLIHLALPNARIIHCRRDSIDTCLSCFSLLFDGDQPYSYDLGELGRFFRAYERLMAHWRRVLPKEVMLDINYEGVVTNFEQFARQIVAHCGLEWDDVCLGFYRTQRPVRTSSMIQVRRPIYRSSVGRWRSYTRMLGPLFEALEVDPPSDSIDG